MLTRKFKERRKYQRLSIPVRLKFKFFRMRGMPEEAVAHNISGGGVALRLDRSAKNVTRLKLLLYFPGSKKPVTALSEVVWCKRASAQRDDYYNIGIKHIKIIPSDKERLVFLFCEMMINYLATGRTR